MTTIKASCPLCGEVSLTADDILLRIGSSEAQNTYGFDCPTCSEFVEKPADERVIKLLLSGGVMPVVSNLPAETRERHEGPAITYDDILAFHELLKTDDWFEKVLKQQQT